MVDIGDGIKINRTVHGYMTFPDAGCAGRVEADYDETAGRYRIRKVEVEAIDGHELTGTELRKIRVADVLRDGVQRQFTGELWPVISRRGTDALEVSQGPTNETLKLVALVYRLALVVGDGPTNTVADQLGIPRSTAGRWVTRARDRGLLTVSDRRGGRTVEG
jgi:hypothetical protein